MVFRCYFQWYEVYYDKGITVEGVVALFHPSVLFSNGTVVPGWSPHHSVPQNYHNQHNCHIDTILPDRVRQSLHG